MENLEQNLKKIIEPQIQECVSKIKDYISNYSLSPVLEKAFINDNFIYEKSDGTVNDDCKLTLYVGDLFLTYQKNKILPMPNEEQVEIVFNSLIKLVNLSMTKEIFDGDTDIDSINYKVLFKYTERSFYVSVMLEICKNIIDEKWLLYFFSETGFHLYDVYKFSWIYKNLLLDRYEQKDDTLFSVSFDELFFSFQSIDNTITKERLHNFIEYFTCKESNNRDYLLSMDNPLMHKPFINIDNSNRIICCDSLILIKNCFFILEEVLKKDERIFTEYGATKGVNFENKVKNIFKRLFPNASFYSGLEYYMPEDKKMHEVDLLIDTGNYLLIVESKGRSFQENAKKGNEGSYKRSVKKIIQRAHEQCISTYNYLLSENNVVFKKNGEEYLFYKKSYLDIYLITVELDNLDEITSDIYKTVEVFQINPIITFSIYDLFIIQDILEKGSIFLNYIEQRRGSIKQQKTTASTEIDYLSYFISVGLFFDKQKEIIKDDFSELSIGEFSDEIDKYYFGEVNEKPRYKMVSDADFFFQQLNKCDPKLGFTIEKEFLTSDLQTQNNILSRIDSLKQQAQIREKSSVFSFILESEKMGISFICFKNNSIIPNTNYFLNYMHDKQSNYLIGTWAFIVYSLNPYEVNKIIIEK